MANSNSSIEDEKTSSASDSKRRSFFHRNNDISKGKDVEKEEKDDAPQSQQLEVPATLPISFTQLFRRVLSC